MPSKEYVPAIIEAEEKERKILEAKSSGDILQETEARLEFEQFIEKNSRGNGVRRMAFNSDRSSGKLVSDRADNRIKNGTRMAMITAATISNVVEQVRSYETSQKNYEAAEHNASELDKINGMKDELDRTTDTEGVLSGATTDKITKDEYTAFTVDGNSSVNPAYLSKDAQNQICYSI